MVYPWRPGPTTQVHAPGWQDQPGMLVHGVTIIFCV